MAKRKNETVAEKVEALRAVTGLKQREVAARAGKSEAEYNRIAKGRNLGTSDATKAWLAAGFGVSVEDMRAYLDGRRSIGKLQEEYQWEKQ